MASYQRFVAVFDTHGDCIDPDAAAAFFEFLEHWKPHIRVHGGDAFDLRALRRGASDEEKADGTKADVEHGLDFLKRYDPHVITLGNHDDRLWEAAMNDTDAVKRDYCTKLIDLIHDTLPNMKMLPYDKREGIYRLGHLKILHGYHSGMYAARQAALVYGSCLQGHTHIIDHQPLAGLDRRMGRVCGCLCKLDMPYAKRAVNTLRWAHGWAYGLIMDDGTYHVWQAEQIGGRWFVPTTFAEIRHGRPEIAA